MNNKEKSHEQIEYYYIRQGGPSLKNTSAYHPNRKPIACVCIIKNCDGTFSRGISICAKTDACSFNKATARSIAYGYAIAASKSKTREIGAYALSYHVKHVIDIIKNYYGLHIEKYWIEYVNYDHFTEKCKSLKTMITGSCWPIPEYFVNLANAWASSEGQTLGVLAYYKGRAGFSKEFLSEYEKKILDV